MTSNRQIFGKRLSQCPKAPKILQVRCRKHNEDLTPNVYVLTQSSCRIYFRKTLRYTRENAELSPIIVVYYENKRYNNVYALRRFYSSTHVCSYRRHAVFKLMFLRYDFRQIKILATAKVNINCKNVSSVILVYTTPKAECLAKE